MSGPRAPFVRMNASLSFTYAARSLLFLLLPSSSLFCACLAFLHPPFSFYSLPIHPLDAHPPRGGSAECAYSHDTKVRSCLFPASLVHFPLHFSIRRLSSGHIVSHPSFHTLSRIRRWVRRAGRGRGSVEDATSCDIAAAERAERAWIESG